MKLRHKAKPQCDRWMGGKFTMYLEGAIPVYHREDGPCWTEEVIVSGVTARVEFTLDGVFIWQS